MSQQQAKKTTALPELEHYEVIEKLAVGGMAAIFSARRKGSQEICVIKALHDHYAQDPIVANRFLREAQVAAMLQHPKIAHLTDAKREGDIFFLAMEYIAGQDLETMMFRLMEHRRMLPPGLTLNVAVNVMEGLHHAHEFRQGDEHLEIVHRDLSPRNVMITYDGDVKVIDFGLARAKVGEFRTAPQMILGTLRYMSPEQATAEPVDRRSDIYSFGTVIYEGLSGRPFIRGNDAREITQGIIAQIPKPLSTLNPSLPPALDPVLAKAMEKRRDDRYNTADEFRRALLAAAPDLCATPREHVGDFVQRLFPEEFTKALALVANADEDAPAYEPTRAGPAPKPGEDVPIPAAAPELPATEDEMLDAHYAATAARPRPGSIASLPPAPVESPERRWMLPAVLSAVALLALVFVVSGTQSSNADVEPPATSAAPVEPKNIGVMQRETAPPPPKPAKKKASTNKTPRRRKKTTTAAATDESPPPPAPPPPPKKKKTIWDVLDRQANRMKTLDDAFALEERIKSVGRANLSGDDRNGVVNCATGANTFSGGSVDGFRKELKKCIAQGRAYAPEATP